MKEEFQSGGGGDGDVCVRAHTHVIMYVCRHTHTGGQCVLLYFALITTMHIHSAAP